MWYDVTRILDEETPVYPGDTPFSREWQADYENGYTVSAISLSSHLGTHLDAPRHFSPSGRSISELDLRDLIMPARLVTADMLTMAVDEPGEFRALLIKSTKEIPAYMSPEVARKMLDAGIILIGTDQMSIEDDSDPAFPVHCLLAENQIPVIEGLLLGNCPPGNYKLYCAPLLIRNAEAAPCRVWLEAI